MKKIKYLIFALIVSTGLFFLFGPEVLPENLQFRETLNLGAESDVIIIFNSGGWGNTPLEEAMDFTPIVEEIEQILNNWGYDSIVVPYKRTKDNLFGKISGAKDSLDSFKFSSKVLAEEMEFLTKNFPNKKIIIAGLSNGGSLVRETMKKVSEEASIYAIEVGTPFWAETFESENVLKLNNNGKDSLATGEIKHLVSSLIKAPFKWIFSKFDGQNLCFSQAIQVKGHEYFWSSPEVGSKIVAFLEDKFR